MNVLRRKFLIWALEDAYWANWCGDWKHARAAVIRIADEIIKEEPEGGKGQQKTPFYKQEKEKERDEFLIR